MNNINNIFENTLNHIRKNIKLDLNKPIIISYCYDKDEIRINKDIINNDSLYNYTLEYIYNFIKQPLTIVLKNYYINAKTNSSEYKYNISIYRKEKGAIRNEIELKLSIKKWKEFVKGWKQYKKEKENYEILENILKREEEIWEMPLEHKSEVIINRHTNTPSKIEMEIKNIGKYISKKGEEIKKINYKRNRIEILTKTTKYTLPNKKEYIKFLKKYQTKILSS